MHMPTLRSVIAILCFGFAHSVCAEQSPAVKIRGEVVDPALYLREGRHGGEVADQTYEAVDGGQALALLEENTGTLYLFLAAQPGEDPNELVYDSVNKTVTVTGTIYERGGVKGIEPTTVELLAPPTEPTKPKTP